MPLSAVLSAIVPPLSRTASVMIVVVGSGREELIGAYRRRTQAHAVIAQLLADLRRLCRDGTSPWCTVVGKGLARAYLFTDTSGEAPL